MSIADGRLFDLKNSKRYLRAFLQTNYMDERLVMLLAHAQSDKLDYWSCCCLIGIATADHSLRSESATLPGHERHYQNARLLPRATEAEWAYFSIGKPEEISDGSDVEALRRRIIIPIIRAEIKRREHARSTSDNLERFTSCAAAWGG